MTRPASSARYRWLGHPGFLVCVLVLGVNDHVLKARLPGWWTGKLSDVAGVAIVGTVAAVLAGPRRGMALTGVGFALLKTVPTAAELASPVLGGVTRTDPTDLAALVVLVPLYRLLRTSDGHDGRQGRRAAGDPRPGSLGAATSAVVPLVGSVAAVLATTATTCSIRPTVIEVVEQDDALYAAVQEEYYGAVAWARSGDGGRTWTRSDAPAGRADNPPTTGRQDEGRLAGPIHACAGDGTCYRLRDQRVVERRPPGGRWVDEVGLTEDEFEDISTGCADPQRGVLTSIVVTDMDDGTDAVASLGADGVLVRDGDGTWARARVLGAPPIEATPTERGAGRVVLLAGPVLLALWVLGRRRSPVWADALAVGGLGWLATVMLMGVVAISIPSDGDRDIFISRMVVVCTLLTAVAAAAWALRPWRPRLVPSTPPRAFPPSYPPPPVAPPPPPPPPPYPPTLPPFPPPPPPPPREAPPPRPTDDDGV